MVRDGPNKGETCVFPFTYKNKTYTKCSTEDVGQHLNMGSWCPTKVKQSFHHTKE
jgi:hypothetical protein